MGGAAVGRLAVDQRARVERREQPLVRVDDERVGALDAGEAIAHARRAQRAEAVGAVDVQPQPALARTPRPRRRGRRSCPRFVVPAVATTANTPSPSASSAARSAGAGEPPRPAPRASPASITRSIERTEECTSSLHRDARGGRAAVAGALARGVQGREVAVRAALDEAAARRVRQAGEVGEPAQRLVLRVHGAGRLEPRAAVDRVDADQQVDQRARPPSARAGDEGEVARVVDRGAGAAARRRAAAPARARRRGPRA